MATATLAERVTAVEQELAQLRQRLAADGAQGATRWWERRFGAFADSPEYEEATRLGREYRQSLLPRGGADEAP